MDELLSCREILPKQVVFSAAVGVDDCQTQGAAQQKMPYLIGMQTMQTGVLAGAQQEKDGGAPRPFTGVAGGL